MKSVDTILKEVFSNPTAPYRENWVLDYVQEELSRIGVPYFRDSLGNVIAGVKSAKGLRHSRRGALVAHTDHPGFHLVKRIAVNVWKARWFGGAPKKLRRSSLAIYNPRRPFPIVRGVFHSKRLHPKTGEFLLKVPRGDSSHMSSECFGAFDFPGFRRKGFRVSTRAADDLTGVAIILATLARLNTKERQKMLGIFTRAEETGFRGALGMIYQGILGEKNFVVSLEASRQLAGARIGEGPVVRLGDKRTLFDTLVTSQLDQAVQRIRAADPKYKFQRRIMDGGTCEATAFNLHGVRASGLAVPLGNYHNQRADHTPGAEYIDVRDVEGAVRLCVRLFKDLGRGPDSLEKYRGTLRDGFKKDKSLLSRKVLFERKS